MTARVSLLQASKPSPSFGPSLGLASAGTPPLRLPAEHFAAAMTFFVIGTLSLALVARDLASGTFLVPHVAAVVHLFTLGFVSMSIFGALYQFLPIAVGAPIRSQRLAHATFALLVTGVPVFAAALATSAHRLVPIGAGMVALAFLLFAVNFMATLAGAIDRGVTFWALSGASLYLVVTLAFGFTLALNLSTGFAGAHRFELLVTHVHVAIVGWVMLVMVGVGHRLMPMFMLSHGASETPARIAVACLVGGCALIALPLGSIVHGAGWLVIAAGIVAFLVQAAAFYRHRKKSQLDPGMRLAMLGLGGVGAAVIMAPIAWVRGWQDVRLLTAYVFVLVVGGISLFIAGHYFKIVPFLVWYHRFGSRVGKGRVPRVADLYSGRMATVALVLLGGGVVAIASGILSGCAELVRDGALAMLAGACVEAREMLRIARAKPT